MAGEMKRARGAAMAEAQRQFKKGRGGGSCLPWRGSCTDEAYAIYQAIKRAGPYKYIDADQVRRTGHSAVAVFPKGRENSFDKGMIVFDPYKAKIGDYWHQTTADKWQGTFTGMYRYKGANFRKAAK
jgi:hypothetical protein